MPEINDQMVTPAEIGDDELQQWLTSVADGADIPLPALDSANGIPPKPRMQEGGTGEQPDPNEPGSDPPDDDDEEEEEQTQEPGGEADYFTINGNRFERADIERLYNFDQYMRNNPDVAQRVNDAIITPTSQAAGTGTPPVPETPAETSAEFEAPEPPDFLDLDDPVQRFQWESHIETRRAIFDRDERDKRAFAQMAAERQQQAERQAATDMQTALGNFKEAHPNLNDDDIAKIRQAAAPYLPAMIQTLPPVEALSRSMEVAAVMDNDLRDKITDPTAKTPTAREQSRHRKGKLGQISGSGRSAPRTEPSRPAYTSDKDMLNELAAAFSEQMQR